MAERATPESSAESEPWSGERSRTSLTTLERPAEPVPSTDAPLVGNGALARALGSDDPTASGLPPEVLLSMQGSAGNQAVASLMSTPPGQAEVTRDETGVQAPTSAEVSAPPPVAGIEQQGGAALRSLDTVASQAVSSGAGQTSDALASPSGGAGPGPVGAPALEAAGLTPGPVAGPPVAPVTAASEGPEVTASPALELRDTAVAAAGQAGTDLTTLAATDVGTVTFSGGATAGEASALISEFLATIGARAAALAATGTAIAAEYRATAAATAGQIRAAAEERAQAVAGHVARLTVAAQADAGAATASVAARRDATKTAVTAATAGARAGLETEYTTSLAAIDARLATHLAAIDAKYTAADAAFRATGKTVGDEAAAIGAPMAEAYMAGLKDESDGFWDGPLTYNRGKARRDTALEISQAYQKGLIAEADKQADQAQAGHTRDVEAAQATAAQAREALRKQHTATLATLDQAQTAALQRADDAYASLTAAITQGQAGGQQMLGGLEATLAANIRSAAETQAAEVEHQAALLATATLGQVGRAVDGLLAVGADVTAQLQGAPAPSIDALSTGLANATAELDAGVAAVREQVAQSKAQGDQRLAESAQTILSGLGTSTQQGMDAATSGGGDMGGAVQGVAAAGDDAFGSIEQQHSSTLATMTAAADSGYGEVVAGVDRAYTGIAQDLDQGFARSTAGLEQGLRGSLAKMPGEIRTQAEENAARVPPRWKKIAKWALIIAAVVVVALVVGPFVIGAVGAALGTGAVATGVIAGAIVGAATGATIQVINNWAENRPLGEGVLRAALVGAIGGAVGGGFGAYFTAATQAGTTVVNTAFRQFLANSALNVVTETVLNVATTGQFSWSAVGMAVLSAVAVGGALHAAGGLRGVQGIQESSMAAGESFGGALRTGFGGVPTINSPAGPEPGSAPARETDVDWDDPNVRKALGLDPVTGKPTGTTLDQPGQLEVDPARRGFDPANPAPGPYRGELGQLKGGEFAQEGVFEVTPQDMFAVRVGPAGSWVDHLFATQAEAMAYAQQLAARGNAAIRETSALPHDWPGAGPGSGNPVDVVRVLKVPKGTPTIRSVVAPQPESSSAAGLPATYPGGGPQTQLPKYIFPQGPGGTGPSPAQIAEFPVGAPTAVMVNPPQSVLAQPGGLSATEGTRVANAKGKLGPPSHPLTEHGPEVSLSDLRRQVVDEGKKQASKFTDRALMEQSIAETIDARTAEIEAWLATNPPAGANKAFEHAPGLGNLGAGFVKNAAGQAEAIQGTLESVRVVLKSTGNGDYVIQSAFPF